MKKVLTINNVEALFSECRKFEAGYYLIGDPFIKNSGDCYEVDGSFYREETGRIVYDMREGKYVLRNGSVTEGIIDITETGEYNIGHFRTSTSDIYVNTSSGYKYPLLDESLIKDNNFYKERLSDGEYYHISVLEARDFKKLEIPDQRYKESLPYDSKGIISEYQKEFESVEIGINSQVKEFSQILEELTFGIEFETTKGIIPNRILKPLGTIPLRDGSISGLEYVTVPMSGAKGLQTIINLCEELEKRTEFDNTCSLHIHIGNVPRTKEFILAFFKMTLLFQDILYSLFPLYKEFNFGVKRKNYTKPYKVYNFLSEMDSVINESNIDKNFNVLFQYLAEIRQFRDYNNDLNLVEVHPLNPNDNQKWNVHNRYHWNNLVPFIFGNKQTIEFRIHTPTYDASKIINFLILNSILINFTIKNTKDIISNNLGFKDYGLKTLENVILSYIDNNHGFKKSRDLSKSLQQYLRVRYDESYNQKCNGDIIGKEENISGSHYINWNKLKYSEFKSFEDLKCEYFAIKTNIERDHLRGTVSRVDTMARLDFLSKLRSTYVAKLENGEQIKEFIWE